MLPECPVCLPGPCALWKCGLGASVIYACRCKLFSLWSCHSAAKHLHLFTPSLEASSVFTFASCLFFDISLRAVHTVWLHHANRIPAKARSQAGLGGGSSLALRKLALIGPRGLLSEGPAMPPRRLARRPSWNGSEAPFSSCMGGQAGRQWGWVVAKRKQTQNRKTFQMGTFRTGFLKKVLNQLNRKYKPMQC